MSRQSVQRQHKDLFITAVPKDLVDSIWPEVEGYLQSALDQAHGEMNIQDVQNFIMMGNCQLWVVLNKKKESVEMAVVTEVIDHKRIKVCRFFLVGGGNTNMWLIASEHIQEWAKSIDCYRLEGMCRPGLEKVLKPIGYKKLYTVLAKEI